MLARSRAMMAASSCSSWRFRCASSNAARRRLISIFSAFILTNSCCSSTASWRACSSLIGFRARSSCFSCCTIATTARSRNRQ